MKRSILFAAPVAAACLVLAGCGGSSSDSAAPTTAAVSETMTMPMSSSAVSTDAASATEIVISNFQFTVPATVTPGQQITIRNDDTAEHTVTADTGGAFDVEIEGGETATLTAPEAVGTYAFHCTYHPKMLGTLTVG